MHRTVIASGLEFHHIEQGEGQPLVLLHGVLGDLKGWGRLWTPFAERFRTLAYSRRYNWPNRNEETPSPHQSAIIEAQDLAELLPLWGASPAVLVGASYGAFTALALALADPEKVSALVLFEPPMFAWPLLTEDGRAAREAFDRDYRLPAQAMFARDEDQAAARLLTEGIIGSAAMSRIPEPAMARLLESVLSLKRITLSTDEFPMFSPEQVRSVRAPTLLLGAENSPEIHQHVYRNLSAEMSQAECARIPRAGHAAERENPEVFLSLTLDFLKRHGLAAA
jgi:pimeloyl-ACP methyl ester carboxylesterase